MTNSYTKTVWCFSNKNLSKNFIEPADAINYANLLLREGEKVKIYDYRPPRQHVDLVAEKYPDGPPGYRSRS